jgi:hypothetical protein
MHQNNQVSVVNKFQGDWEFGSSSRAQASQAQGPEFKPQYHQK